MKVTAVEVTVHRGKPRKDPLRDALQSLPGAGSVQVVVRTDDGASGAGGATGTGDAYFGRIAGGPDALGALIEHELKPLVIGSGQTIEAEVDAVSLATNSLRRDNSGVAASPSYGASEQVWVKLRLLTQDPHWLHGNSARAVIRTP